MPMNKIFHFVKNPYDISSVQKIFNNDLIKKCIESNTNSNNTYKFNPNWQKFLVRESFSEPIDFSLGDNSIKRFDKKIAISTLSDVKELVKCKNVVVSGHLIYPPTGYMGWHTNYKYPCKRLYITYASEDKKSFFRYRHPVTKEIITDYDNKGITIREFLVTGEPPYFWHCIGSDCIRISFGYRINSAGDKN